MLKRKSRLELLEELVAKEKEYQKLKAEHDVLSHDLALIKDSNEQLSENIDLAHKEISGIKQETKRLEGIVTSTVKKVSLLETEADETTIELDEPGHIIDSSSTIHTILSESQVQANEYIQAIEKQFQQQETEILKRNHHCHDVCLAHESKARKEADRLLQDTEEKCNALEKETTEACLKRKKDAKESIDAYWKDLSRKLENFYEAQKNVKDLFKLMKDI